MNNYISSVVNIYSKALYEIDNNNSKELKELSEIAEKSPDLQNLMLNPTFSIKEKHEIIDAIFKDKFSKQTVSFLKILADNNRFNELTNIVNSYLQRKSKADGYLNVKVISAIPLKEYEKINILKRITAKMNQKILPEWGVDKSIIAGLVFKIGDNIFDTSVAKNINDLSKM